MEYTLANVAAATHYNPEINSFYINPSSPDCLYMSFDYDCGFTPNGGESGFQDRLIELSRPVGERKEDFEVNVEVGQTWECVAPEGHYETGYKIKLISQSHSKKWFYCDPENYESEACEISVSADFLHLNFRFIPETEAPDQPCGKDVMPGKRVWTNGDECLSKCDGNYIDGVVVGMFPGYKRTYVIYSQQKKGDSPFFICNLENIKPIDTRTDEEKLLDALLAVWEQEPDRDSIFDALLSSGKFTITLNKD